MSISRMEAQHQRLNAKIERLEAQLSDLKGQRKELKARLAVLKKAAKEGRPPPEAEAEGLVERIGATLSEAVLDPLANLLSPKTEKGKP